MKSKKWDTFTVVIASIRWQNPVDWDVSINGSAKSYQKSIRIHWMSKCCARHVKLKLKTHCLSTRYTFIDLAQIVCKLPETRHQKMESSSSSDEEYDGYISEPTTLVSVLILILFVSFISLISTIHPTESQFIDARFEPNHRIAVTIGKRIGLGWIWVSITIIATTIRNDIIDNIATKWYETVCIGRRHCWPNENSVNRPTKCANFFFRLVRQPFEEPFLFFFHRIGNF